MTVNGSDQPRPATAPTPRRMARPKWLNLRVLLGVLVVVGAVVAGAKVIGAERQLATFWATTTDLQAGTVLTSADLSQVELNLDDSASKYLGASVPVVGKQLLRPLGAGELLPSAAVGEASADSRLLAISIDPSQMVPGLGRGSVIDLYLVRGANGAQVTKLQANDLTVQDVIAPSSGGLSGASNADYHVVVRLPTKNAQDLIIQLPDAAVRVLLHPVG